MWKTFSWCYSRSSRATAAATTTNAVPSCWWSRTSTTTIRMPDFSHCRSTITLFPLSIANKRWSKGWSRRCRVNTRKTLWRERVLNSDQWTWRYIPRLWPKNNKKIILTLWELDTFNRNTLNKSLFEKF